MKTSIVKKLLMFIAAGLMLALTACGNVNDYSNEKADEKLKIVTTIFPEYDWVREILGEKADEVDLKLLIDNGVDLHSYQPTPEDLVTISDCDVFIYVGGESDGWVIDAINNAANKDMVVVRLIDELGGSVKEEEVVEGMQGEEEEEEKAKGNEPEYDEHVWLSLKNAQLLCEVIADKLAGIDQVNAELYKSNAAAYSLKLKELDDEYRELIGQADNKTLLFGDRFPFRYMADDYDIRYYAAFAGCSAETEASFETITFLAGKVDELGLKCVMTLEGGNQKLAEAIIDNTKKKDQKIFSLDSMQSVTKKDVENGTTYIGIMKSNLEVLKEAF